MPGESNSSSFTDIAAALESVATVLAFAIGGLWTYLLFVKKRLRYPKASIKHSIEIVSLNDEKQLVHLALRLTNTGEILVRIDYAQVRLLQVAPLDCGLARQLDRDGDPVEGDKHELDWPLLSMREWKEPRIEIEPGETEILHNDFVIGREVQSFQIYSFVQNSAKKKIGWQCTTFHHVNDSTMKSGGNEMSGLHAQGKPAKKGNRTGVEKQAPKKPVPPGQGPLKEPSRPVEKPGKQHD